MAVSSILIHVASPKLNPKPVKCATQMTNLLTSGADGLAQSPCTIQCPVDLGGPLLVPIRFWNLFTFGSGFDSNVVPEIGTKLGSQFGDRFPANVFVF